MISLPIDNFQLFFIFVVPGFIAMKTYGLLYPSSYVDTSKQIVDAISYSCLNYAIWLFPIYLFESYMDNDPYPYLYWLFYIFVLFIFPVILAISWGRIRQHSLINKFVPHPMHKAWDFIFSQSYVYWVIVNLKNGEKIAGKYGYGSCASRAPAEEQIYLEEEWLLNEKGGFDRPVEQTSGVLITSSDIISIEFFDD